MLVERFYCTSVYTRDGSIAVTVSELSVSGDGAAFVSFENGSSAVNGSKLRLGGDSAVCLNLNDRQDCVTSVLVTALSRDAFALTAHSSSYTAYLIGTIARNSSVNSGYLDAIIIKVAELAVPRD